MTQGLILGDSLEELIDHRGKTPRKLGSDFTASGIPVASAILVRDGRLHLEEARFVDEATYARWMKVPTRRGDVILTSEAPLGRVARVYSDDPLVLGQRLFGLRGRKGVLDSGYLYYVLQTDRVQAELVGRSTGTTVFGIRQSALRKVVVPAPSYAEQRAIAEVLGALDDKIAANDRLVATGSSLAQSLYVGALVEGSYAVRVGDVAQLVVRGIAPKYVESGLIVLNQKCIRDRTVTLDQARTAEPLKPQLERILRRDDVLVNSTGQGTLGRVARWVRAEEVTVDSHVTIVRFAPELVSVVCAGYALMGSEKRIEALAEGSTGQTELRRDLLKALEIRLPERSRQQRLAEQLSTLDDLATGLRAESIKLANVRDELLPLLMSRKVRVKDAEKVVGEVT